MARNEDEAARRRAKRREARGEDATPDSANPAEPVDGALTPGDDTDAPESGLGDTLRAETESHAAVTGSPIGLGDPETDDSPRSELAPTGAPALGGEVTTGGGPRLFRFFRASWAELKRVRWPNRQQVGQGTVVTLGFVIIAGAFLGVADVLARQIVNLIL